MGADSSVPGPSRSKQEENQLNELDNSTIPATEKTPGPAKRRRMKAVQKDSLPSEDCSKVARLLIRRGDTSWRGS